MEPGAYSLTVLVRRVGAKASYDSFVKTQAFFIKSNMKLSSDYYESEAGSFKMKFPESFDDVEEFNEEGVNSITAIPSNINPLQLPPTFSIITAKTEQGDTLDKEMSNIKDELIGELTSGSGINFAEKSRKQVTLGDQEGYLVEYDLSFNVFGVDMKAKELALITLNENGTHVVTFITTSNDWALNSSVYMESLLSFIPVNTQATRLKLHLIKTQFQQAQLLQITQILQNRILLQDYNLMQEIQLHRIQILKIENAQS